MQSTFSPEKLKQTTTKGISKADIYSVESYLTFDNKANRLALCQTVAV